MGKVSDSSLKTGEIVLSAIKKLMRNTGWTTRTIVKFIKMEYKVTDPKISQKISRYAKMRLSRALKRGVRMGLLQLESGRYRLNEMSRLARPVSARLIRIRQRQSHRERPLRLRSRTPSTSSE